MHFVQDVESSLAGNHELDIRPQNISARQRKMLKVRIMKCRKFLNVRIIIYIIYIIYQLKGPALPVEFLFY